CKQPYYQSATTEIINENDRLAIARHEILCNLDDVIRVSSQLLRNGGKAAFVHRPERLMDILTYMRKYRLEPKRMRFVYPKQGKEANTVLIEGTKNGKSGMKLLPPLFVYDDNNEYTMETKEILYGKE